MSYRLVVVTYHGIYHEPRRTLERFRAALLACGATGLRRNFLPEWERYFPGRSTSLWPPSVR
jgi:hypothetical protein